MKWFITTVVLGAISLVIQVIVHTGVWIYADILLALFCVIALLAGRDSKLDGTSSRRVGVRLGAIYGGLTGISSVFVPTRSQLGDGNTLSPSQAQHAVSFLASPEVIVMEILFWILMGIIFGIFFAWIGGLLVREQGQ